MARPNDRMRLKDRIIDNISKAIKSIQELHFYQLKDPVLGGSADVTTLCNSDRPCHKLCENLDHALLHGLKQVTHGYWRIVKQLSHKGMVKEIDLLTNVTTDLGRGRAWLYASLNEGLLESYIRLLGDHEKLLRKYYAKEALVLDVDRMNVLLTLTSGLECAIFQLEYDLPYLDLNAYPPRSRTDAEPEGDILSSRIQNSGRLRSGSEVCASSSDSSTRLPSDSDSSSQASVDVHSLLEQANHMRVSTISSDSGFPMDTVFNNFSKQRSVTPTDTVVNSNQPNGPSADTISLSSVNSSGDPDRIKRLESIVPAVGDEDDEDGVMLEVIRVKSKKSGKLKKKKAGPVKMNGVGKDDSEAFQSNSQQASPHKSPVFETSEFAHVQQAKDMAGVTSGNLANTDSEITISREKASSVDRDSPDSLLAGETPAVSIPQYDSGVDICGLATGGDKPSPASIKDYPVITYLGDTNELQERINKALSQPKSALAEIESKIAELCSGNTTDKQNDQRRMQPHFDGVGSVEINDKISAGTEPDAWPSKDNDGSTPDGQIRLLSDSNVPSQTSSDLAGHQSGNFEVSCDKSSLSEHSNHEPKLTPPCTSQLLATSTIKDMVDGDYLGSSGFREPTHAQNPQVKSNNEVQGRIKQDLSVGHDDDNDDDDFDVYASHSSDKDGRQSSSVSKLVGTSEEISKAEAASHFQDYMDFILRPPDSPPVDVDKDKHQLLQEREIDYSFSLDNNTKLQVMLDIFTHEDEQFVKMFVSQENHTEGEAGVVYVLISDKCLYLLHYQQSKKFRVHASAMLVDLIFISTGLYDQTLNIESRGKNKQKQRLWLTPGHQALTQSLVTCLTDAVKTANENTVSVRSRFSVGSEVPLQKIALRKYISKELLCEAQDVVIGDFSLVFWEDPSALGSHVQSAITKEGTLYLCSQDPLKGHVWKPVHAVLRNSILSLHSSKADPRPQFYLGLGGDQCIGCRLTSVADKDNCVELVLSNGRSWIFAAISKADITNWRHKLCLAVSQGVVEDTTLITCTPCCAVLSCNHLFLCHEDLQTKFYRTLGRAQLEDVTGISVDSEDPTYCVIEFESTEIGVSSEQWVFYFTSPQDMDRHKQALSAAWREIFKVELPITHLDNVGLQSHCHTHSDLLKKHLTLR